jgi:hypothetical protein
MCDLTLREYKNYLESVNYNVTPDELKEVTKKLFNDLNDITYLYHEKAMIILTQLKDKLSADYEVTVYEGPEDEAPILDIYLGFSGLKFIINNNGELVLIEEQFYDRGACYEEYKIILGEPSIENIIRVINIFIQEGTAQNKNNPSMLKLLQIE